MKKKVIYIVSIICIFIIMSGLYIKKCSELKKRDNYISESVYYSLIDLDNVLDTYSNMDDSNYEAKEKKNKYYSDMISRRMISLKNIYYLDRDNDKYASITQLGHYLLLLLDIESYDKEKLKVVVKELRVFNASIKNYVSTDKNPFIYDLINPKSTLHETFMKIIEKIE